MYEETFNAAITGIKVTAKHVDGAVRRAMETTVELVFTESIARSLNQEATRESLRDFSLEQAKISMTDFSAIARFYAGKDQRSITVRGKTATCNTPSDEDGDPTIKIPMVSQFDEEELVYLARNLSSMVKVRFTKCQLELADAQIEVEFAPS